MVAIYSPPTSCLLYGPPGAGKTMFAVSSFFDCKKEEVIANGKLITFGVEDNPALGVPEECRMIGEKTSLRLVSPLLDSRKFEETFQIVLKRLMRDNMEGNPIDVLVIDSISEFDKMYEYTATEEGFARWRALMDEFFATLTLAHPRNLGCPVIVTARVSEKRKATATSDGDPDYMNFNYYPSIKGGFRLELPHYFNLVLYQETRPMQATEGPYKGKKIPFHITHLAQTGDFYVKNQAEHKLMQKGLPLEMVNGTWPEMWELLASLKEKNTNKEEGSK